MECGRSIGETKRHDYEFICAITRSEGGFEFITRFDGDLMITGEQIEFGEILSACESIVEIIDARQGEVILFGDLVQTTIINTHANRTIFLFDQENRGTEGAGRRTNMAM